MKKFILTFILVLAMLPLQVFAFTGGGEYAGKCTYDAAQNVIEWENGLFAIHFYGSSAYDVKSENGIIKSITFPYALQVQMVGKFDMAFLNRNNANEEYTENLFTTVEPVQGTYSDNQTNFAMMEEGTYTIGFMLDYGTYSTGQSLTVIVENGTQVVVPPVEPVPQNPVDLDLNRDSYFTQAKSLTANAKVSPWAKDEVNEAFNKSIVPKSIFEEGNYQRAITRKEFAYIMVGAMKSFNYSFEELTSHFVQYGFQTEFTDSNNDLIIQIARINLIINGVSDTSFAPEGLLTREQASTMLERLYDNCQTQYGISKPYIGDVTYFVDRNKFSSWAAGGIDFVSGLREPKTNRLIMGGIGGDRFAPEQTLTVEQALIATKRLLSVAQNRYQEIQDYINSNS